MTSNEWIIVAWVTMLGGCIGSFLNVVIYRWPAGMSVVSPASACPRCGHAIRWHHNIPVLGWLVLGGRCFDCRVRISIRYPLVEAFVAIMFLSLAIIYLVAGRPLADQESIDWTLRAARFGLFALLICTLLCSALMQFDSARVPFALQAVPLILALASPFVLPALREPPLTGLAMPTMQSTWMALLFAVGLTLLRFDKRNARTTFGDTALIATMFGIWGIAIVAPAAAAVELLWNSLARSSKKLSPLPWSMFLLVAVSVALLSMRVQFEALIPESNYKVYVPWILLLIVGAISIVSRKLRNPIL